MNMWKRCATLLARIQSQITVYSAQYTYTAVRGGAVRRARRVAVGGGTTGPIFRRRDTLP